MNYYKFVSWDACQIEDAMQAKIPQALQEFDKGNKQPLKDLHIATQTPVCRVGGWAFPYSDYMRRFFVKTKYYGVIEMYAMNKADIRKELKSYVIEIAEVC